MVMTEATFSELVQFINTHPKWRRKLQKALFPDIDVAKAFQDLAESQRQMKQLLEDLSKRTGRIEENVSGLKTDVSELKTDVSELKTDVSSLKTDVSGLKTDVSGLKTDVSGLKADVSGLKTDVSGLKADVSGLKTDVSELKTDVSGLKADVSELKTDVSGLKADVSGLKADVSELKTDVSLLRTDMADVKGYNYESRITQHSDSIFGLFMRRGKNARNTIGLLLEEAEDNGVITAQEHNHVLALDLLWKGKEKESKADIVLAIEVSWRVEETDITRAVTRANTLRKMGLTALPVVAGSVWDEAMTTLAYEKKVVVVTKTTVDALSWENAFNKQ